MTALRLLPLLAVLACNATIPAQADEDARALYLGTWQGTGTMYATPYSKAGPSSDTTTCSWAAGTTYLVCAQHHQSPYGPGDQLTVYTHSEGGYSFQNIDASGTARTLPVLVKGTTWTYASTFDDSGSHVSIRTVNEFPSPGVENWYTEYSKDGGKHWTRMAEGVEHLVSPAP